jgi:cation:H+ antiporter
MNGFLTNGSLPVSIILGIIALAALVLAANEAVKRLCGLAEYFNLSTTFMGMTVVSLATSIPEIAAHLTGSVGILRHTMDYQITSAIVLGANIGSDVVQQTLIMGLVAMIAGTLYFRRYFLTKNLLPMILVHVATLVLGWNGVFSRLDGGLLFGAFILYMYYLYWDERKHYRKPGVDIEIEQVEESGAPQSRREATTYGLIALGAMACTVVSATIVLEITESVVHATHIGASLIGVATLGVASALPELTSALAGVRNKEHGISLGTLIGSNITNPLVGIGLGALVSTYWVPRGLTQWDLPWAALSGALIWALLWFTKGRLNRWGAAYLIIQYCLYIGLRALFFFAD